MPANAPPSHRGRIVDIGGGRTLHAVIAGPTESPEPLVVLEAGAFGFSADWAAVQDKLARRGLRSMAYDRAGLGFSPPGPEPRDGRAITRDLEQLLAHLGEIGPFILCGHSMAGLHVRLFAARNPGRVVGAVLVDATTPEAMDSKMVSGFVEQFGRASRLAAWGAEIGLLSPLSGTGLGDAIGLEGPPGVEKRWAFAHAGHNHWAAEEVAVLGRKRPPGARRGPLRAPPAGCGRPGRPAERARRLSGRADGAGSRVTPWLDRKCRGGVPRHHAQWRLRRRHCPGHRTRNRCGGWPDYEPAYVRSRPE